MLERPRKSAYRLPWHKAAGPCEGAWRKDDSCTEESVMKATTTRNTTVKLTRAAGHAVRVTCAAGLFLAAWAPDALAQSTSKTKNANTAFTTTIASPCTGEAVDITGQEHLQSQSQENGRMTRFTFKLHQSGKGVAKVSFAQYQYQNMSQNTFQSTTSTFYVRMTFNEHLIRNGPRPPVSDDFFARKRLLIRMTNGQPEPRVESFEAAECK
jgi:hypothetical protein